MKDAIVRKITARELHMHSKYYFIARVVALIAVSAAIFFISIFICNFILFSIRINSADAFLSFGPRGWQAFFAFFPWDFLALDAALIVLLLWLMRQFKFGYRSPAMYTLLSLCAVTLVAGFVIDRTTGLNEHFEREAGEHHLPEPFRMLYESPTHRLPAPGEGVCKCVIVNVGAGVLTLYDVRATSTTFTAFLPPNDPRATTSGLRPGNVVFVAGDRNGGTIRVFGIQKLSPGSMK